MMKQESGEKRLLVVFPVLYRKTCSHGSI